MRKFIVLMKDFHHSFNRRCKRHDYRSRCIYMITMLKSAQAPLFSSISRNPKAPEISPLMKIHPAGRIIHECLGQLCLDYPRLAHP